MKIYVIIPAYNEQTLLPGTLDSLVNQTRRPDCVVVVDDGSTDDTPQIVDSYDSRHDFIRAVHVTKKEGRATGAKVVKAFNAGLESIQHEPYDVVCKMDADLIFPSDYFERLVTMFEQDARVGMAGGTCAVEKEGEWIRENIANMDFLRGPIKAYRRSCFEDMGGLRAVMGWDTLDLDLAKIHGWKIRVDNTLLVKHLRPTNKETGWLKTNLKNGRALYRMRYGLLIGIISALKRGVKHKPYVISAFVTLYGYFKSWIKGESYHITKEEASKIRKMRLSAIRKKLPF